LKANMSRGDVYRIGETHEYVEQYRKACKGCGEAIVMAIDYNDRWHPFDPETGDSHYATCTHADLFRKT